MKCDNKSCQKAVRTGRFCAWRVSALSSSNKNAPMVSRHWWLMSFLRQDRLMKLWSCWSWWSWWSWWICEDWAVIGRWWRARAKQQHEQTKGSSQSHLKRQQQGDRLTVKVCRCVIGEIRQADVSSWYQLTAPDNDRQLWVSMSERREWNDGMTNKVRTEHEKELSSSLNLRSSFISLTFWKNLFFEFLPWVVAATDIRPLA